MELRTSSKGGGPLPSSGKKNSNGKKVGTELSYKGGRGGGWREKMLNRPRNGECYYREKEGKREETEISIPVTEKSVSKTSKQKGPKSTLRGKGKT